MSENKYRDEKVPFKEKICYGIGAMGAQFQLTIIGSYLLIFLTDVIQIDPIVVGGMFLVGQLCDAFTDIGITNIADKTRTRWGTYRPWILSGIPLAICFMLNFIYPDFLTGQTSRIIWMYVVYILTGPIFQTSFLCPFMTMNNVMSRSPRNRMGFAVCRSMGESTANVIVNALVMTIVLSVGTSIRDLRGWRYMAIIFAVLSITATLIGFLGTRERIPITNTDTAGNKLTLIAKLKLYHKNYVAIKMLIITVAFYFFVPFSNMMFSYFCIYNLGHEEWVASLSTVGMILQTLMVLTLPWLGKRYSCRTLVGVGGGFLLTAFTVCLFAQNYIMAFIFQLLKGIGAGLISSLIWLMWPEVSDYTEERTGIAAPGIMMAIGTFFMKIGVACASFMSTWILDVSGYEAALAVQSPATLLILRCSFALIPAICVLITMISNHRLKELKNF